MSQYFSGDYTGGAFVLFGLPHLTMLALALVLCISMFFWKPGPVARRRFRYGLAVAMVLNEMVWQVWNAATGQWTIQTMLPLHLCSALVWGIPLMLVTSNYLVYELCYFWALGGATQALLTPALGIYGFPHLAFFLASFSHIMMLVGIMYMTAVEGLRPTWKSLLKAFGAVNVAALIMLGVNALLGSNYMFVSHKPATASPLDMLPPWPWYLIPMEIIGIVVFVLLYLPFAIQDWKKAQGEA